MSSDDARGVNYHMLAAKAREQAEAAKDPATKSQLERIAKFWEDLAASKRS